MQHLEINGIRLALTDVGDGEPVLFLHGYPDSGAVWRYQVDALRAAGYRVLVPDLRGYGASERPQGKAAYRLELLLGDVLGLLDALGLDRVHLVCLDWGASLGWMLAALHGPRFESLAALSVGHPQCFFGGGLEQKARSWYVLLFQFEDLAERILSENDWAFFREFAGHHPECDRWIADLSRPGALTAALNWYRANVHPAQTFRPLSFPRVAVPTLGVWSSGDAYLTEAQMAGSAAYLDAPWRYERVEGAGHWLQVDRPAAVNALLLDWLQSRVGA
ncbi:MAG: alpha/beta fold hydrolase [Gammaproteobacteria bacterium]